MYIIGITGGSGSGKTTIVKKISEIVGEFVLISQDNYYKDNSEKEISQMNFDHPDAFDFDLFYSQIKDLSEFKSIEMPIYDFINHKRLDKRVLVKPKDVIIVEGIMIFFDERLRKLFNLKIFIDTPSDIRFIRRLERDIKERGRTVENVITQYLATTRPGYINFIDITRKYADLVIPEGGVNENALYVLTSFLKNNDFKEEK